MGGTWTSQNKILPGAYINFLTNAPLSITVGDRGIVVILQEVSKGSAGDMYKLTALDQSEWPAGVTAADKFLAGEALKGASTVIVYNLGSVAHDGEDLEDALEVRRRKPSTCFVIRMMVLALLRLKLLSRPGSKLCAMMKG